MSHRPETPRTVKPRRETDSAQKPIMVVTDTQVLIERTGEIHPVDQLPALVASEPSSIVACHNAGVVLHKLDKVFDSDPDWQFRVNPVEKETYAPERQKKDTRIYKTVVAFFGFQGRGGKRRSKYHYPIDPLVFCRRTAREIVPSAEDNLSALFAWAKDTREWLVTEGIPLKPTSGGVAAQFLRDRRFYPDDRRKVPRATNAKVRDRLPGNHYRLVEAEPKRFYTAYYLDQSSAHHNCAKDLRLPASDSLYARGNYLNPDDARIWAHPGGALFSRTLRMAGLFKLKLDVPSITPAKLPPPFLANKGMQIQYVYSNELDELERFGVRIVGIICAWASPDTDAGLPKFARWALDQTKNATKERRAWLKSTLLSVYGVLASRPRALRFGYKRAKGGESTHLPVGSGAITVKLREVRASSEPNIVNVVHRGMIEAETRKRTLDCARFLTASGCCILAVYADSVFVEAGSQLPFLPDGWRVQQMLTSLQFLNATQFTSREMTKLPGVLQRKDGERVARHNILRTVNERKERGHSGRTRRNRNAFRQSV